MPAELARLEKLLSEARRQLGDPVDFDGKGALPAKPNKARKQKPKRKAKAEAG